MRKRNIFAAIILFCCVSCGVEPGRFSMDFTWDTPPHGEVWVWARVEERDVPVQAGRILASAGPVSYEVNAPVQIQMDDVPNGTDRYLVIEVREGQNPTLPILYYGISESFSLAAGAATHVDVPMILQVPEALAVEAQVMLEFDGTDKKMVNLEQLRNATVVLESAQAVSVMMASDAGVSENLVELLLVDGDQLACEQQDRDGLLLDVCRYSGWDLAIGKTGELPEQQYSVFVKFLDRYGYESQVYRASAILDSSAPKVVLGSLSPAVTRPGADTWLNVNFNESVAVESGLTLHISPDLPAGSSISEPQLLGSSTTCLWTISLAQDWTGTAEIFTFSVDTIDALGNSGTGFSVVDSDQEQLTLAIDFVPPLLLSGAAETFSANLYGLKDAGEVFLFEFVIEEALPHMIVPEDNNACQGICLCAGICPVVKLGNSKLGNVYLNPDKNEPDLNRLAFYYEYAVDTDDFAIKDSQPEVSVSWTDQAGNTLEELVPGDLRLDFQPPDSVSCSLVPEAGNAASVFSYTITVTESLAEPPDLVIDSTQEIFTDPPTVSDGGLTYNWKQSATNLTSQLFTVGVSLVDEAQNLSNGVVCSLEAVMDGDIPVVSTEPGTEAEFWTVPEVTGPDGVPLIVVGDGYDLYVSFQVTNCTGLVEGYPDVRLAVPGLEMLFNQGSATQIDDDLWSFEYQMSISKEQHLGAVGMWPVQVILLDQSGNQSVTQSLGNTLVTVDLAPPVAICSLLPVPGPDGYGVGQEVSLLISPLEDLSPDILPVITEHENPAPDTPFFLFDAGTTYRFTGAIGQWSKEGNIGTSVALVDLVGNQTQQDVNACLTPVHIPYDAISPSLVDDPQGFVLSADLVMDNEPFTLAFTVVEPKETDEEPLVSVGGRTMTQVGDPVNGSCLYTYAPNQNGDPPDEEGIWPLSVTLEDGAGNITLYSPGAVRFDFTAPMLTGTPGLFLTPAMDCPLTSVTALGAGAQLEVTFGINEILDTSPTVWYEGSASDEILILSPVGSAEPDQFSYTYRLTAEQTAEFDDNIEGIGSIMVQATDLAGNQISLTVPNTVSIDTKVPSAPDVESEGRIVFTRIPWGSDGTGGKKAFYLRGGEGAIEAGATVRVYDSANPDGAMFLGQQTADADGLFGALPGGNGAFKLVPVDLLQVYVEALDGACNRSSQNGGAVAVRDGEWVATMGYKEAGSTAANPHSFSVRPWFVNSLWWGTEEEPEAAANLVTSGAGDVSTAGASDWRLVETDWQEPPVRAYAASAYDSWRHRTVIFGGIGEEGELIDTWEFNGVTWIQMVPEDPEEDGNPLEGFYAKTAMAFDALRGKTVLFNGKTKQTWEWDGVSWSHRNPIDPEEDGNPNSYNSVSMFTNPITSMAVLVTLTEGRIGIWTWDGHSWLLLEEAVDGEEGKILPRRNAAVAYDKDHGTIMIYGGIYYDIRLADTWAWDGTNWHELTPAAPSEEQPLPVVGASMVYDEANGEMLLFGGQSQDVGGVVVSARLWKWTGAEWSLLEDNPDSTNPDKPGESQYCNMIYDQGRERVLLMGGRYYISASYNQGTYEWLGDHWKHRFDDGTETTPPFASPVCYSDSRGTITMYRPNYYLWQWNRSGWWEVPDDSGPGSRLGYSLVCDETHDRVLLFGGMTGLDPINDLWEWNYDAWTQLYANNPDDPSIPSQRSYPTMAHDPDRDILVLFGGGYSIGMGQYQSVGETWELNGDQWTLKTFDDPGSDPENDGEPSPRMLADVVYHPVEKRLHLLNGSYAGAQYNIPWHDHWTYNGTSWEQIISQEPWPEAHSKASDATWQSFFDPILSEVVMVGAHAAGTPNEPLEVWRWRGSKWEIAPEIDHSGDDRPEPRKGHAMTWYAPIGQAVLFGGQLQSGSSRETWFWNNGAGERPGQVLRCSLSESGLVDSSLYTGLSLTWSAGAEGTDNENPVTGARLLVWDGGSFVEKDVSSSPASEKLTWSTDDVATIQQLAVSEHLVVGAAVTPVGTNWKDYATVTSSYVELVLTYRLE